MEAQALIDALNQAGVTDPKIVMLNGPVSDSDAAAIAEGAHSVFDPLVQSGQLTIADQLNIGDLSSNEAQTQMGQALSSLSNQVDGVFAANDQLAAGAIEAMAAAGLSSMPPVAGSDADVTTIQDILTNQQYATVYKPIGPEVDAAAQLAVALLANDTTAANNLTQGKTMNNGTTDVPSVLVTPQVVTKANIGDTVMSDSQWLLDQVCTGDFLAACQAAGLK